MYTFVSFTVAELFEKVWQTPMSFHSAFPRETFEPRTLRTQYVGADAILTQGAGNN